MAAENNGLGYEMTDHEIFLRCTFLAMVAAKISSNKDKVGRSAFLQAMAKGSE
jgi:hypothetical protein